MNPSAPPSAGPTVEALLAILPQTQCTKCGYAGCRPYAQALARGEAEINRCPPGGAAGIARLAELTGRAPAPLDPACGVEAPRRVAYIVEGHCIGCTLCIKACPVDAIVGANKRMHTVVAELCTGCDLCLPPCPVDCIEMRATLPDGAPVPAWTPQDAVDARARHESRQMRLDRESREHERWLEAKAAAKLAEFDAKPDTTPQDLRKRATVAAALERARQRARERGV